MNSSVLEELKLKLRNEFSDYFEIAGGRNYRYYHLETVHKIAKNLGEALDLEIDQEVLEIAALYHDIGRSEDIEDGKMNPFENQEGHGDRGAEKVSKYVSKFVNDKQLEKIKKIIRNHHSEAETVEGKIVQDANKLSNFGVSNIWRSALYSSHFEETLEDGLEYFYNHQLEEYKQLIEDLYFEQTRKVAEERLEKHTEAIRQIEKEINGEDF